MNQEEVKVLEIDDKNYFLVDTLMGNGNTYRFFSEMIEDGEICVLKDKLEDGEEYFVSLDDDNELEYALSLFEEKYGIGE